MAQKRDGAGIRDMARWPASNQPLAPFFDSSVGSSSGGYIPCGICSVETSHDRWAICPRRLLTLGVKRPSTRQNPLLQSILSLAGFSPVDKKLT